MKLTYLFFLILAFTLLSPAQAASPDIIPGVPNIPPPPQIGVIENLEASSTEEIIPVDLIKEKQENIKKMISENENIKFSEEVYQDYHDTLLVAVANLNDYAPDYLEWSDKIFSSLEYLLNTEREIQPLVEKIKNEKGVKRFFLGLSRNYTDKLDIKLANALEKVGDLQWVQERQKDQKDWARLGQEVYNLRFGLEEISDDMEKEKEEFSILGWIKSLFP